MSESMFSPSWYRVAQLKPRLRGHTRLYRHYYRGQRWYVLQSQATRRCHRLSPAAHYLIGLMNGERTTEEVWEAATRQLGDDGPTQEETIRLLGLLYFADVLQCDVTPDTLEMLRRSDRRESSQTWGRILHPMSLRIRSGSRQSGMAR